jgi:hypothetical protein
MKSGLFKPVIKTSYFVLDNTGLHFYRSRWYDSYPVIILSVASLDL